MVNAEGKGSRALLSVRPERVVINPDEEGVFAGAMTADNKITERHRIGCRENGKDVPMMTGYRKFVLKMILYQFNGRRNSNTKSDENWPKRIFVPALDRSKRRKLSAQRTYGLIWESSKATVSNRFS